MVCAFIANSVLSINCPILYGSKFDVRKTKFMLHIENDYKLFYNRYYSLMRLRLKNVKTEKTCNIPY